LIKVRLARGSSISKGNSLCTGRERKEEIARLVSHYWKRKKEEVERRKKAREVGECPVHSVSMLTHPIPC